MGEIIGNLVVCLYLGGAFGVGYMSMRYGSKDPYTAIITGLNWPLVALVLLFALGLILLAVFPFIAAMLAILLLMKVIDAVSWIIVKWRLWKLLRT